MKMNLHISSLQRTTETLFLALALVTGTALFPGCSGDIPVAPDTTIDAAAPATTSPMSADKNGLIVQSFPSQENPGPPLYVSGLGTAPGGFGALRTDGEWVAMEFVRDPDCVPDDYNLLSGGFDIPRVFTCQLTIEGRVWLRDLSNPSIPVKAWHDGLGAVPMYFVRLSEYETAVMDGVLTIEDLEGLSSLLIGYASYHREVLQFPQNGRPGKHNIVSHGELEDGRSFQLNAVVIGSEYVQTRIVFN